ncbi:MAG: ribonuclease HI family protein, partial [Acidimicrobiia bacterium]
AAPLFALSPHPGRAVTNRFVLYCDGASRGNPGPAGIGAVQYKEGPDGRRTVAEVSEPIGTATNNVAEYRALMAGLEVARRLAVEELVVRVDSLLLVRQLVGEYRVKAPGLKPLYRDAVGLLNGFRQVRIEHVHREENAEADALANAALDR